MKGLQADGVVADRFVLKRRLGAGGLAEVWVAYDKQSGAEVALKLLHGHLASDRALVDRFKRELAVTRELQHPGIVRVFDLHEHEGRPLFSMELLAGESLADRLKEGALPPEEARRITREILLALQHAHRAGVVHRDLKPANILLLKDGRVKLLDFGLARAAGWSRQTAQSTVMGTPGYIAPEMLAGTGVDARADLYALGATLFEMLTGKRAFPGADAFATLRAKSEAPPSPRASDPRVDLELDSLVQRALESDVEKRFLDAAQMIRALEGEQLPHAPTVPITLTAGNVDVVVRQGVGRVLPGGGKAIARVIARLGAPVPSRGWSFKMGLFGNGVLVAGTNRAQAEAVVALCQAEGLSAKIVPSKAPGRASRWLHRKGGRVGAAIATAFVGALVGLNTLYSLRETSRPKLMTLMYGLTDSIGGMWKPAFFAMVGLWLARAMLSEAPLSAYADNLPKPVSTRSLVQRTAAVALAAMAIAVPICVLSGMVGYHELAARFGVAQIGETASQARQHARVLSLGGTYLQALRSSWKDFFIYQWFTAAGAGIFGALLAAIWTRPRARQKQLLRGDPAVRRLADGIALRLNSFRARMEKAPPASRMLLEDLLLAAGHAEAEARRLADLAAVADAEAAAQTIDEKDRAIDRLLEIAAALDDALGGVKAQLDAKSLLKLRSELQPPPALDAPSDKSSDEDVYADPQPLRAKVSAK